MTQVKWTDRPDKISRAAPLQGYHNGMGFTRK